MSVASIVRGNDFPEFKDYLKTYSPAKKHFTSSTGYPSFSKNIPIRVPSENITSHESGHIGELADFLFCLEIARYVDTNKEVIFDSLIWRAKQLFDGCIRPAFLGETNKKQCDLFDESLRCCHNYVLGVDIDLEKLVYCSNSINKAEHYLHYTKYHTRLDYLDYFLVPCPVKIVDDVVRLVAVFKESFIASGLVKKDSNVVCHPWFEPWSSEVGGGIADLYLDGVLYDFKSTKKIGFSWEDVGQLYGYYILNRLCLKYSKEDAPASPIPITNINAIAVYYSRLGDIETCNLRESNAVLPDSELEYIVSIIHEHNEERYHAMNEQRLEDIAKKVILRAMYSRSTRKDLVLYTPETIGYSVGDTIYSYSYGKGTVIRFKKEKNAWKTVLGFENGEIMECDINSTILLNWDSGTMLEWRQIFDRLHQNSWSDRTALAELRKKYKEL